MVGPAVGLADSVKLGAAVGRLERREVGAEDGLALGFGFAVGTAEGLIDLTGAAEGEGTAEKLSKVFAGAVSATE